MTSEFFFPFPFYERSELFCRSCGLAEHELTHTGQVGCAECYKVFGDLLRPYIRRIHGSDVHRGRTPGSPLGVTIGGEADTLRKRLEQAIAAEEYEKAAELRDRLRKLEGGGRNE
jgi:protein arginine kinase activator